MTRRKKSWGGYGYTVAIERRGGSLYLRWWSPLKRNGKGGYERTSLGHDDRTLAEEAARQLAAALLADRRATATGVLTVQVLLARHGHEVVDTGVVKHPGEYRRRAALWTAYLGPEKNVRTIDRPTLDRFVALRRAGKLREDLGPVKDRTVGADVEYLLGVLNWATQVTELDGARLLERNPVAGYPVPSTPVPHRPIATYDRFLKVRAVADRKIRKADRQGVKRLVPLLDPQGRFGLFLDLVEALGWRASAICQLRAEDIDRKKRPGAPFGRIRKQRATDKKRVDQWVPLTAELRQALDRQPVVTGYIFPSPTNAARAWSRWHARDLHERAQLLAKLEPIGFHAYRRKWATERKALPVQDVMAAGGWTDRRSLERAYQLVDEATLFAVVSEPTKLREVGR